MRNLQTDILVIGGGATGTGVLRDIAMRGFQCILVERRDLAYGTTGRYHGLLHSGGRYVVKDPQAAKECYEENRILRKILPQCIEDTGGYFVLTPQDDPAYVPQFIAGCRQAGIPLETVPISKMLKQEPWLNPKIQQCFHLPDASADSFLAASLNVDSACQYGAQVLSYHEVISLVVERNPGSGRPVVAGAICHDMVKDEDVQVSASLVINASGPWVGRIAHMAGIDLAMVPGKGTLLALNRRVVNTVINRCKLPSDGDILVPAHSVVVMGTTDIKVADPDHYAIEPWEIQLMLDEGEKLIPGFKNLRILRAWAGVRPLVKGASGAVTDRDLSRSFAVLDHAERDGTEGIITITGGKWTTYRKMAQATADKVCEIFKVSRPCRTHLETLPSAADGKKAHLYLGARLEKIEHEETYGQLICECELVTRKDIAESITQSNTATLDDIRRDTRLGMGPCQGTYCSIRAAGLLHSLRHPPVQQSNVSLRDFLQERWKGNLPILWGQQLRQARLNELIYVDVLNAGDLSGEPSSRLASEEYTAPGPGSSVNINAVPSEQISPSKTTVTYHSDVLVIGGGFAGLFAAWRTSHAGLKTSLINQGWGTPYWSSGCIDIFGYQPPGYSEAVTSPLAFIEKISLSEPHHPYSLAGLPALENAIRSFLELCQEAGYPLHSSLERNLLLPTALGTLRPSCLVPETMLAGDASDRSPMLIVGFDQFNDFYPGLVADNLADRGLMAQEISLDLNSLRERRFVTGMVLARLFDEPGFRQEVIDALKLRLGHVGRVGFPAVLGLKHAMQAKQHLENELGVPVFEIPGLPPSIPGMRLQALLVAAIEKCGGSVTNGMQAVGITKEGKAVTSVLSKTSTRQVAHCAEHYILATGGILGGGIITNSGAYAQETIFNLPVPIPDRKENWLNDKFLTGNGHPIFRAGIVMDDAFHPIDQSNRVIFNNVFVAGSALGCCDPIRERSLEGISVASAYAIAERLAEARSS